MAAMADKSSQKLKFNWGDLDGFPGSAQLAPSEVHLYVAETVNLRHFSRSAAQRCFDACAQLARAERLGHIVVGSQIQAEYLVRLLRFCCEQNHRRAEAGPAQLAAHLEAILMRKHHIENDQVVRLLPRPPARRLAVVYDFNLVAFQLQIVLEPQGKSRFILHNQDASHVHSFALGRRMVNVLPTPGSLSTCTWPPWAATICSTIVSPRPVPLAPAASALAARTNFLKICFCSWGAIPSPLSHTRMATWPFSQVASALTVLFCGEYFTALSSRFHSARLRASRSARTRG